MGEFWSWFIIVLTVGNILACWWLIRWTTKPRQGEAVAGSVTGHTWDENLQEYNNPLPRWWLWLFYITIVFGFVYLALYPGLGNFGGLLGWTQQKQYEGEVQAADAKYRPIFEKFAREDIAALATNHDALEIGRRLFLNNCAVCHGSDAGGGPGFPNLRDGDWLYGGDPQTLQTTILNGRNGSMPAWGAVLGEDGVRQAAAYVQQLSGQSVDPQLAAAGKAKFETYCVACHGADGKGNPALGAPNLTDNVWLYGGSPGVIQETITHGRNGHMPAQADLLGPDKVHLLAAYVYSLSHSTPEQ